MQQSDATRFAKIHDMKRNPANDNAAARRASWEEQTVPRGAGVLGDMWNKYVANSRGRSECLLISFLGSPGVLNPSKGCHDYD